MKNVSIFTTMLFFALVLVQVEDINGQTYRSTVNFVYPLSRNLPTPVDYILPYDRSRLANEKRKMNNKKPENPEARLIVGGCFEEAGYACRTTKWHERARKIGYMAKIGKQSDCTYELANNDGPVLKESPDGYAFLFDEKGIAYAIIVPDKTGLHIATPIDESKKIEIRDKSFAKELRRINTLYIDKTIFVRIGPSAFISTYDPKKGTRVYELGFCEPKKGEIVYEHGGWGPVGQIVSVEEKDKWGDKVMVNYIGPSKK